MGLWYTDTYLLSLFCRFILLFPSRGNNAHFRNVSGNFQESVVGLVTLCYRTDDNPSRVWNAGILEANLKAVLVHILAVVLHLDPKPAVGNIRVWKQTYFRPCKMWERTFTFHSIYLHPLNAIFTQISSVYGQSTANITHEDILYSTSVHILYSCMYKHIRRYFNECCANSSAYTQLLTDTTDRFNLITKIDKS